MNQAQFVLLQEPIAATQASNILCRVVASTSSPLAATAPFGYHQCDATLATAIPKCSTPIRLYDFMNMARNQGVGDGVSRLLDLQGMHTDEQTILLQCRLVKRYLLPDPDAAFMSLMNSDGYSTDVRALLDQCRDHQGYFATGFLTATDESWLIEATQDELQHFNITPPYSDAADIPVPFLYQDLLGPELAIISSPCEQPSGFANEQIFAVSYKSVKLPLAGSPASSASGPISPGGQPAGRRPKRSNAYHLTVRRPEENNTFASPQIIPAAMPTFDDNIKLEDVDNMMLQMEDIRSMVV